MNAGAFPTRNCPGCGSDRRAEEVRSQPRAEVLGFDALRPYWAGFHEKKVFFSYHRCRECHLLFAPVFFDEAQLAELYSDLTPNMEEVQPTAIRATQRAYFAAAEDAAPPDGGYLEIGPDIGHLVRYAARSGRFDHFWLFEPNRAVHNQLAASADPFPRQLHANMSDLSSVPDETIGLAVMIHVLDHLLDPVHMLEQIRRKLRKGGKLLIVTHNERSLLRRLIGCRWPPFCLQHPVIFAPETILRVLDTVGYGDARVQRSANYFPVDFLAQQLRLAVGLPFDRLPLPKAVVRLKLGNMITVATR